MNDMVELRPNKGFHPPIEQEQPYIFIDSCMQAWPDADFDSFHKLGFTTIGVTAMRPHTDFPNGVESLMYWRLIARKYPNIIIIETADDIRRAHKEGLASILMAAQGGDILETKLHRIEALYRLGLRVMIPAYNTNNYICDGLLDRTDAGLSRFGELFVDECNRVGMVLDCTHVAPRATFEIMDRSEHPVIYSHSNPKAVVNNPRNITDEQIKACVERGGVIGLCPWGPLVFKEGTTHWPTLDDFMDIVDHVVQLTGSTEHIGIGTDMSLGTYPDHSHDPWGEPEYPDVSTTYGKHVTSTLISPMRSLNGFNKYADIPNMAEELEKRGYKEVDIQNILGENYLRLFDAVWK